MLFNDMWGRPPLLHLYRIDENVRTSNTSYEIQIPITDPAADAGFERRRGSAKAFKAQMEADRKQLAEAQKKLSDQLAKMDPATRKSYDSMLNVFGAGTKMNDATGQ